MCVYVCMFVYACMRVCVCLCMCVCAYVCVYVCVHVRACMSVCVCVCALVSTRVHMCVRQILFGMSVYLFLNLFVLHSNVRHAEEMGAQCDRVHTHASTHVCYAYRRLYLSGNQLTSVPAGVFNNLTSLE